MVDLIVKCIALFGSECGSLKKKKSTTISEL